MSSMWGGVTLGQRLFWLLVCGTRMVLVASACVGTRLVLVASVWDKADFRGWGLGRF